MLDVITFGSATTDTFLRLKRGAAQITDRSYLNLAKEICFPLGNKIEVKDIKVYSGGGGTNTACSFANLGLKTVYYGKVGDDVAGSAVLDDLKRFLEKSFKLSTSFLSRDRRYKTAASVILSTESGERTALIHRGACHFLTAQEIAWRKIKKTKWFYIAPLSGHSAGVFAPLVTFAKEHKIKVMANLGHSQLAFNKTILKSILSQVDVLLLNREEAIFLTSFSSRDELGLLEKAAGFCPGIVVLTKGREGSLVFDGKRIFQAGIVDVKVVEKTGAGDAFGSGFLAGLLFKNDIEYAIQLATANAASCIQQVGAKNGLLGKKDLANLPTVPITINAP